jgi:hypothetical protein
MAQASPAVNPSVDFLAMSRRIPFMDEQQLASLTATKEYGSLALAEVSRRNRERLMAEAAKQAQSAGGSGTVADRELAALAQQQFADKLAADESMGLNNLVAQAEQGGLEFGSPYGAGAIGESDGEMPMGAGGGMVAFERGGEVPGFAAGALIPLATRALSMYGPRILPKLGMEAGKRGIGALRRHPYLTGTTAASIPLGFMFGGGDEEGAFTPEELQRQYEVQDIQEGRETRAVPGAAPKGAGGAGATGRGGVASLFDTDEQAILRKRRELERAEGLGEFGAKVEESQKKRRGDIEAMYAKAGESEPFLKAAKAVGGKRKSGLEALAAAVGAGGESMAELRREKAGAMDKLAQGEETLALAREQYQRGNIAEAMKMAQVGKEKTLSAQLKMRELGIMEDYRRGQLSAMMNKGQAGMKGTDFEKMESILGSKNQELQTLMKDPKKNKDKITALQQEILGYQTMIRAGMMRNLAGGVSITDQPD